MGTQMQRDAFIDKLYERLVLASASCELYDRAIARALSQAPSTIAASASDDPAPETRLVDRLVEFRRQEKEHAALLADLLVSLGHDPAAERPSVRTTRREITDLLEVSRRPDAGLPHMLHALLAAESIDRTGWELLLEAGGLSLGDRERQAFELALAEQKEHLRFVRGELARLERHEIAEAVQSSSPVD